MASSSSHKVLIYGGRGALGSVCVNACKLQKWWVGNIDLNANDAADANVLVTSDSSWQDQHDKIVQEVEKILSGEKVDAILCVAGGWAGGNAASKDLVKNSQLMWQQSVWSSTIAASLATKHLKEGGVLTLPGAHPAQHGTPGMIGYGMAKAAVHQLTKSLASEKSGLPSDAVVYSLLPITLDTPMNRKWMPKADTSSWTPLEFVAELLIKWSSNQDRPASGSLVQLITSGGKTDISLA